MNENSFWEVLSKDPADSDIKKVFADWLEDKGHYDLAYTLRLSVRLNKYPLLITEDMVKDVVLDRYHIGRFIWLSSESHPLFFKPQKILDCFVLPIFLFDIYDYINPIYTYSSFHGVNDAFLWLSKEIKKIRDFFMPSSLGDFLAD